MLVGMLLWVRWVFLRCRVWRATITGSCLFRQKNGTSNVLDVTHLAYMVICQDDIAIALDVRDRPLHLKALPMELSLSP